MKTRTDAGAVREFLVDQDTEGQRLDRMLEPFLPGFGLRQRRRLIETGRVLVEDRPAPASLKMRLGQRVRLLPEELPQEAPVKIRVVVRAQEFAAVNKPAGLHSAALAGGGGQSLEALLPELFPERAPRLLNRLDFLTSGLVLVGLNAHAAKVFAALKPATVVKEYLAVVQGELTEELQLKRALDADDRKRTRVLGRLDPEPRSWTLVWPESALAGGRTLVRVRIQSGARHQIRAHLAAADLPIVGDPLYGEAEAGERLFLHHRYMEFQGFSARCEPGWLGELVRKGTQKVQPTVQDPSGEEA